MTKTILVADDSRTIRHVVSLTFVATDIRVVPAESGRDAIDRIKNDRPDLVLADVGMPGMDGYQLCQELKQSQATAGIPVVLMAGAFEPFDERRAQQARADGHIKKPFETTKLIEQVKTLLAAPPIVATPISPAQAVPVQPAQPPPPVQPAQPPPPVQPAQPPPPVQAVRSPAIDDLVARPAQPFSPPVAETRGGWDDIPVSDEDESLPMDETSEELEEGEAYAARAAAYGPSLEPPPAPDPELEAHRRSVDVWALQDDGSVVPPRTSGAAAEHSFGAEDDFSEEARPYGSEDAMEEEPAAAPMVDAIGQAAAAPIAEAVRPHAPGLTKEELVKLAREVIERVAWEVVPELAETIIREEIRRLLAEE
ncbi:MAG: response regulator [Myxococcota bacterium]